MSTKGYKVLVCPLCSHNIHMRPSTRNPGSYHAVTGCVCLTNAEQNELIAAGSFFKQHPIRVRLQQEAERKAREREENLPPSEQARLLKELSAIMAETDSQVHNTLTYWSASTQLRGDLNTILLAMSSKIALKVGEIVSNERR